MKNDRPCVLIYNPISGHGHLDSWNAMFIALLLDKGWRVLALTPDVSALTSRLEQRGVTDTRDLHVLDWNAFPRELNRESALAVLRRLGRRWDTFGDRYCYRRAGSEATPDMPFLVYWRTRILQKVVPFLFRAPHFLYARYRQRRSNQILDGDGIDLEAGYFDPEEFAARVNAALRKSRWKPSIIFNMYVDTYRTNADRWIRFEAVNRYPWVGIRFVPSETASEGYYALPSLRGMCFLDDDVCRIYGDKMPAKSFEYLPDITETALPEWPSELAEEIRRRAGDRKIVFLGGSIGGQKNLARWYDLVERADAREWYFVQIGELHRGTFTAEDLAAFERILEATPENLFIKAEYLHDERTFNDIIATSDILFAVYRDFRISSNMLCKAASFGKPILVSDRYLLGSRVTRYGIGRSVAEDDAGKMLEALNDILHNPVSAESFSSFCTAFSVAGFALRLDQFLSKCISR